MTATLAPLPESGWTATDDFKVVGKLSEPVKRNIEPVGPGFLAHARRTLRGRTWSEDEQIEAAQNVKNVEDENDDEEDEPEDIEMLERDPKDWKQQDHYAVLGISKYRYKATEDQIRNGHRRKVLKHHPDKKAKEGGINQDGFFKCIQKAFETLMDPVKRAQFDSVDEEADVHPPSKKSKGDFISQWTPVFESEARFSKVLPVPSLGTMETTKDVVDKFYSFWYNFDSWRTFEYLDEEVPDDTSNRDNKRFVERKNKAARTKRKTEDTARLRKLVDDALAADPRIRLFKENAKKEKERIKWEREAGAREAAEAEKRAKEEAEQKAKEAEASEKNAKVDAKKAKEAAKNAKKKNKRTVRNGAKDANYFVAGSASAADIDNILSDIDSLIDTLDDLQLGTLAGSLNGKTDATEIKTIYSEQIAQLTADGKISALKYFK